MKRSICCVVIAGLVSCGAASAQEDLILGGGAEFTITDPGSELEVSRIVVNSDHSYGNRLYIKNGAYVRSLGSMYVSGTSSSGLPYGWLYSYASITGDGSLLDIGGDLSLWSYDLPGYSEIGVGWGVPCSVTISGGAEVSVAGDISIRNTRKLILGSGGKLTVGSDFNTSMNGFSYSSGSTLTVAGQLSGLSALESGRRLEAVNILGDITVHGTFAPGNSPANSVLDGILTVATDGTLEMELGGHLLGTEYDRLTVTDTANLDGTLDIVLLDDFSVAYGDSFDLFNWDGGVSGEFSSISSSALTGDLEWDTSEIYTTGTLSVIPEPSVIALVGIFGGGIGVVRRFFPAV